MFSINRSLDHATLEMRISAHISEVWTYSEGNHRMITIRTQKPTLVHWLSVPSDGVGLSVGLVPPSLERFLSSGETHCTFIWQNLITSCHREYGYAETMFPAADRNSYFWPWVGKMFCGRYFRDSGMANLWAEVFIFTIWIMNGLDVLFSSQYFMF